jgi:hypothetical protein
MAQRMNYPINQRLNMKTTNTVLMVAAALAVAMGQKARAADHSFAPPPSERWILSVPRTLEEYPGLLRQSSAPDTTQMRARADAILEDIKKNKAFASSPRVREEFPELDRSAQVAPVDSSKAASETEIAKLLKNPALARSPRMLEIYPWLATYDWDASTRNIGVVK